MKSNTCFPIVVIRTGAPGVSVSSRYMQQRFEFAEGYGVQMRFERGRLDIDVVESLHAYRHDEGTKALLDLHLVCASMTQFSEDHLVFEGALVKDGRMTDHLAEVILASVDSGW